MFPIVIVIWTPTGPQVVVYEFEFEYYTEWSAVQMARLWKWAQYREPPWSIVTKESVEFTKYGHRYARGDKTYSPDNELNCTASTRKYRGGAFHWCWLPMKERDFSPLDF